MVSKEEYFFPKNILININYNNENSNLVKVDYYRLLDRSSKVSHVHYKGSFYVKQNGINKKSVSLDLIIKELHNTLKLAQL